MAEPPISVSRSTVRAVTVLGTVNAAVFALYAILSFGMAPLIPFGFEHLREQELFRAAGRALSFLGGPIEALLAGRSALADRSVLLVVYGSLIVVPFVTFVVLLAILSRRGGGLSHDLPERLFRWAVLFALLAALAAPVLVQDFWLSVAWGRMAASGQNPYYTDLGPETADGLPLDNLALRMTYGPLWASICAVVMAIAGGGGLAGAVLFRCLLLGAWLGCLVLVRRLLAEQPPWERAFGIAVLGWLPLGPIQAVADGHNDVVLLLAILLWLACLAGGRTLPASVALGASALVKYVTLPLFALDLLRHLREKKRAPRAYLSGALGAIALGLVSFGAFYRGPGFFAAVTSMERWEFFTLENAALQLARLVGIGTVGSSPAATAAWLFGLAVRSVFPALALVYLARYLRRPDAGRFLEAVLAVISGILYGVLGHLWPWFLLWPLALAPLLPRSPLTRWTLAVILASPVPTLTWAIRPGNDPSLLFYGLAFVIFLGLSRFFRRSASIVPPGSDQPHE
jgi:hypothetical protein